MLVGDSDITVCIVYCFNIEEYIAFLSVFSRLYELRCRQVVEGCGLLIVTSI